MRGLTRRPLATTRRNARARTFGRYSRLCPLRRSLPSQRIATGQARDAHAECAKRPNASQPRRRSGTHFAALHTNGFAAESRPHTGRIPTAIQWKHEGSRIVHPMIPDLAVAARRLSAARRTHPYITLGSHAKSGPRMRRSPQTAVPCGRRNRASLSPTDATEPTARRRGSAHPDHRLRGWNRVASPRRDGRIPAAFRRPSDADTKSPESSIR